MHKRNTKNRTFFKVILILILVLLICVAGIVFIGKFLERPLQVYYEEPCPDGVWFGTSATYRYWMAPEAYMQEGITIYSYTAGAFSGFAYKYFISDLLKHQDPKMIIIEMRPFAQPEDRRTDHVQIALDYMPFSIDKYKLLAEYLAYAQKYDMPIAKNPKNYLPVQFRSDKTLEIVEGHIVKHSIYKGFLISNETDKTTPYDKKPYVNGVADLPFDGNEDFIELLDYCDTLDCKVIFVATPITGNLHKQRCLNWMSEKATDRGYDVINFNTQDYVDAMGLDPRTDFYNSRHTNIKGAYKFTSYAAKLLKDRYNLEDHRGDSAYESWEESGKNLRIQYKKLTESMP